MCGGYVLYNYSMAWLFFRAAIGAKVIGEQCAVDNLTPLTSEHMSAAPVGGFSVNSGSSRARRCAAADTHASDQRECTGARPTIGRSRRPVAHLVMGGAIVLQ
jgi:hypothetical protein